MGQLLIQSGLITEEQLGEALAAQMDDGGRVGFHLVRLGYVTPEQLAEAMEGFLGFAQYDVQEMVKDRTVLDLVPPAIAHYYQLVPVARKNDKLHVAMRHAPKPGVIAALKEVTGLTIEPVICPRASVVSALEQFYGVTREPGVLFHPDGERLFVLQDDDQKIQPLLPNLLQEDTSALVWLRTALVEAVKTRCREIHLLPDEEGLHICFRMQDRMVKVFRLSASKKKDMERAIMALFRLDPDNPSWLHEGSIKVLISGRRLHLACVFSPTLHGTAFTMRFVDQAALRRGYESLLESLSGAEGQALERVLRSGRGVILVAGNSGESGFEVLPALIAGAAGRPGPVLMAGEGLVAPIEGVTQLRAEPGPEGMSATLFSAMRHNPVVLAADRVRDRKALEACFLAAPRGLVLAGVSARDGFSTLRWLASLGFKSALKAGLIAGILEIWNARVPCPRCASPADAVVEPFDTAGQRAFTRSAGCPSCEFGTAAATEWISSFWGSDEPWADLVEGRMNFGAWLKRRRTSSLPVLGDRIAARAAAGELDASELDLFPRHQEDQCAL